MVNVSFKFKLNSNLKKLEDLNKNLKQQYVTRIGVLGDKAAREEEGSNSPSNADILLVHETGSFKKNIPRRSVFESLNIKKNDLMKEINGIVDNGLKHNVPMKKIFSEVGIEAWNICQKAFDNGGYGTWPELTEKTIQERIKKNSGNADLKKPRKKGFGNNDLAILVDSSQLKTSIVWDVVKK